jgi:hypothetical protein
MRGNGFKNVVAENLRTTSALRSNQKQMNYRRKLCWRCQKDQHVFGGSIKIYPGGLMKFICKDCLQAMEAKKDSA